MAMDVGALNPEKGVSTIMILYKYYGAGTGKIAIESQNLGFRKPGYFNDPFELSALSNSSGPLAKQETLRRSIESLKDQVVILSLTRSPDNPLMWAHYGEEHTGFVVGYDISGAFLGSPEFNLVTADAGDVLYTNTKSPFALSVETMDAILGLSHRGFGAPGTPSLQEQSIARRLFLTKHACWVYEEEVRIVKLLDSLFEDTETFQSHEYRSFRTLTRNLTPDEMPGVDFEPGYFTAPLNRNTTELYIFNHRVPIKEIYLGARSTFRNEAGFNEIFADGRSVYQMRVNESSWQLERTRLSSNGQ